MITALLTSLILAQGVQGPKQPETWAGFNPFGGAGGVPVLSLPLTTNGAAFADSAQTVSHLTWDGRHNLLPRATLEGGGSAPTGWTQTLGTGTSAPVASIYGNADGAVAYYQTAAAERPYFTITTASLDANKTYVLSLLVESVVGTVQTNNVLSYTSAPAGAVISYPDGGGTAVTSGTTLRMHITTSSTAGTAVIRVGLGGSANATGEIQFSRPALEAGTSRGSAWVPTTTAARLSVPQESISGVTWTGDTVPAVASTSSPFSPGKAGAGVFGATAYYSGGTSVGEFGSSDWSASVVFSQASAGANQVLLGKMADAGVNGWYVRIDAAGTVSYRIHDGVIRTAATANTAVPGINVVTIGRSGASCFVRLNGGSNATSACGTLTSSASESIRVGGHGSSASTLLPATTTTIYEVIASTEPYSDALHLARWQAATGLDRGPVSVTRAEAQTYSQNGSLWQAAPATLAVTSTGSEVWKASANQAAFSEALDDASWLTVGTCSVTANQGPAGFTDLDLVQCTGSVTDQKYKVVASLSGAGPFTVSAWVASNSGSKVESIVQNMVGATTAGTCTCSRSDGGSCTTGASAALGWAYTTVDTTPVRLSLTCTPTGTATSVTAAVHDGQYAVSSNVGGLFGRIQSEAGGYATPYIPALAATATRSATVATVPLPTLGNRWCVSVTATPGSGRAWGSAVNQAILWGGGPSTAADSWSFIQSAANLRFRVYDSTATVKYSNASTPSAGAHRLTGCNNSGAVSLCVDGVSVGTPVGAGTGLNTTSPTTLRLGWDGNGADATFWDGTLSNVKVCRGATKCSDCR